MCALRNRGSGDIIHQMFPGRDQPQVRIVCYLQSHMNIVLQHDLFEAIQYSLVSRKPVAPSVSSKQKQLEKEMSSLPSSAAFRISPVTVGTTVDSNHRSKYARRFSRYAKTDAVTLVAREDGSSGMSADMNGRQQQ